MAISFNGTYQPDTCFQTRTGHQVMDEVIIKMVVKVLTCMYYAK